MSKRLITSIKTNIAKLTEKIEGGTAEIKTWELQREKFVEMLELVEPKEVAAAPAHPISDATVAGSQSQQSPEVSTSAPTSEAPRTLRDVIIKKQPGEAA